MNKEKATRNKVVNFDSRVLFRCDTATSQAVNLLGKRVNVSASLREKAKKWLSEELTTEEKQMLTWK